MEAAKDIKVGEDKRETDLEEEMKDVSEDSEIPEEISEEEEEEEESFEEKELEVVDTEGKLAPLSKAPSLFQDALTLTCQMAEQRLGSDDKVRQR